MTVTNSNNCTATATTAVSVAPTPNGSITSNDGDNTICSGTSVTFTAGGGTHYQFYVDGVAQGSYSTTSTFATTSLTNGQSVTAEVCNDVTFDGVITETTWGAALATSAGGPTPGFGAGHEVNALYAANGRGNDLYVAVAGNVQNGNRILVFIDSKTGGYSNGNFGRSGAPQGVDDFNSGTTFDSGFLPDYCLVIGTDGSNYFWDLYTLSGTAGSGGGPSNFLGDNSAARLHASPANGSNTKGFEAAIDKALLGYTGGTLQMMVMYTFRRRIF